MKLKQILLFVLEWRDAYKNAIKIIRSSGWNGLLIVDASAYAQNSDGLYWKFKPYENY